MTNEHPNEKTKLYDLPKGIKLKDVIGAHPKGATVLSFYSEYCPPCKVVKPHIRKIADEAQGHENEKLPRVIRINRELHDDLFDEFAVFSIPCLVLLHDGRPVHYVNPRSVEDIQDVFFRAEIIGFA